uniref:Uncharacterized protein n=1 Tax=Romanomermis culicivorax TaxID=13658 RepID=A0A915II75_ROMCU
MSLRRTEDAAGALFRVHCQAKLIVYAGRVRDASETRSAHYVLPKKTRLDAAWTRLRPEFLR